MKSDCQATDREIRWLIEEKYGGDHKAPGISEDVERLSRGEPIAYIIGFVDFLGTRIDLSQKPLIPRPETEFWVNKMIATLSAKRPLRILDVFAGSGCIGVAVAKKLPLADVDFAELSEACIKQIRLNVVLNRVAEGRTRIIQSDIFSHIRGSYDVICANPPYGALSRKHLVSPSVLAHEPHSAIFGGEDGLLYIRRLVDDAPRFLKPGGVLWMEFDAPEKEEIEGLANKSFAFSEFFRDQFGEWRYASLRL